MLFLSGALQIIPDHEGSIQISWIILSGAFQIMGVRFGSIGKIYLERSRSRGFDLNHLGIFYLENSRSRVLDLKMSGVGRAHPSENVRRRAVAYYT